MAQTERVVQIIKDGKVVNQYPLNEIDGIEVNRIPVVPDSLKATGRISTIYLSWKEVTGADSYNIYRSSDNRRFTLLADHILSEEYVDETPLADTAYYKVSAVKNQTESRMCEKEARAALLTGMPNNELWYVTKDNTPIDIYHCTMSYNHPPFDREIVSHTYENGIGKIICDGDITGINDHAIGNSVGLNITEIKLPNTIERLGIGALSSLCLLKQLFLPDSLKYIESYALGHEKGRLLERFVGRNVSEDGRCVIIDSVLYGFAPAGLTEYTVPDNVTEIYYYAFAWCPDLKKITFNEGLRYIQGDAFLQCSFEEITLPNSLKGFDTYAFRECPNIKAFYGNSTFVSEDHHCLFVYNFMGMNTLSYFAGPDLEEYTIPEGIHLLENYSFQYAKKLKKLTMPQSIRMVGGVVFYELTELEQLYGPFTTSDHRALVINGELQGYLPGCKDSVYIVPNEVKGIGYSCFNNHRFLEKVVLHDSVEYVGGYAFGFCPKLKTVVLSARLKAFTLYNPFLGSNELEEIYFRSFYPPSYSDQQFYEVPNLTVYVPEESINNYISDKNFEKYHKYMKPYKYTDLPEVELPDYYISSDYSKDGEVITMQSATVGKGIDLVFIGDGFVDTAMGENGSYEKTMREAMEKYFSIEPYKTLRNRFNVYAVKAVSLNDQWGDDERHTIMTNDATAFEYAAKVPEVNKDRLYVNVIYNWPENNYLWCYRSYTTMYGDGSYVAYGMTGADNTFIHEAAGHGFPKLADEYVEFSSQFTNKANLDEAHKDGWFLNVDYHSDSVAVLWHEFISDTRYTGTVGIYEGAYTYATGIYRPTENSMMRYNNAPFNAPSREAIYKAIMRESEGEDWVYNREEFVQFDAPNIEIDREYMAVAKLSSAKAAIEKHKLTHATPKIIKGTWRDAVKPHHPERFE